MQPREQLQRDNARLTARLALMALGSFAFGFALVPLYDVLCAVTGLVHGLLIWQPQESTPDRTAEADA